ncbi:MAG: glycerol-3-phosphate 1-O-acyltransferase PlsY [Acidimicrobiia bacterium]|nr:glycerol-3-phosphate 1-O-acyltransferase PlsY [Acidimicrobiia bacterium]MDH5503037.1 glycerol-3-phosphate 1-O-acyltransferase PlsY [Acidimicrobiia bacterium]
MISVFALVAGYLLGSVDFAVLVGKLKGVDIYSVGSGNPGTSNVLRTMGKGAAVAVLVGDLLKGLVAGLVGYLVAPAGNGLLSSGLIAAAGFMAVVGHCYPLFHRFKGGKGIATGLGVIIWASPLAALLMVSAWAVLVRLTKVAAIGSLAVVIAAIPLLMALGVDWPILVWVGAALVLIVWRHRGNIARMLSGGDAKVVEV